MVDIEYLASLHKVLNGKYRLPQVRGGLISRGGRGKLKLEAPEYVPCSSRVAITPHAADEVMKQLNSNDYLVLTSIKYHSDRGYTLKNSRAFCVVLANKHFPGMNSDLTSVLVIGDEQIPPYYKEFEKYLYSERNLRLSDFYRN